MINNISKLALILAVIISSFGCAASQPKQPEVPQHPCQPCWDYAKETGKEYVETAKSAAVTGTVVAADTGSDMLEYLIRLEVGLQRRVEAFKKNHPEMVEEAELQLQRVRDRIALYRQSLMDKVK